MVVSRIVLIPVIAAVGYEVLRWGAKHRANPIVKAIMWPGILVQMITTKQPSDDQIEVAIVSMEQALAADGETVPEGSDMPERAPLDPIEPAAADGMSGLDDRLAEVARQYDDVQAQLVLPETSADPDAIRRLGRELSRLEPVVEAYRRLEATRAELAGARELRDGEADEEMRAMARDEIDRLEADETRLVEELKVLLLPRDPADDGDVILEIRAGAGGEEAALFAAELLRMYLRYAERHRYKAEVMSLNETGIGGDQGGDRRDRRRRRLLAPQVRGRDPSRPARPGDRVVRPDPHLDRDRRRPAGGRGDRDRDRRGARPPDRRQALVRARRAVGQHDRLGRPDHPPPDRPRRRDPGREEPAQEQGQGDGRPAGAPPGRRAPPPAGGRLGGPASR